MTSVCPALWPPWKRTTISARSDSQSTILPLPSSPHCDPTTTTLPMDYATPRIATGPDAWDTAGRQCHKTCLNPGQPRISIEVNLVDLADSVAARRRAAPLDTPRGRANRLQPERWVLELGAD